MIGFDEILVYICAQWRPSRPPKISEKISAKNKAQGIASPYFEGNFAFAHA